VGEAAAEVDRH